MREASFILPFFTADSLTAHRDIRDALVEHFGGYTATSTKGAWRTPAGHVETEHGFRYTVAAEWTPSEAQAFAIIAITAAQQLEQETLYMTRYDGETQIVNMKGTGEEFLPSLAREGKLSYGEAVAAADAMDF